MKRRNAVLWMLTLTSCLWTLATSHFAQGEEVGELLQALADPNQRQGASIALQGLGAKAVPELRAALARSKGDTRVWATYTLGEIGPPAKASSADLVGLLKAPDDALRTAAVAALGKIQPTSAVLPLSKSLVDENVEVRRQAAIALGNFGEDGFPATEHLVSALKDQAVRSQARAALIKIGEKTTGALIACRKDDALRFDALLALRKVNPSRVKQAGWVAPHPSDLASLKLTLHDDSRPVEDLRLAAESLASLKEAGFRVLAESFETERLARIAADAFGQQHGDATPVLNDCLQHADPAVRVAACRALANIGTAAAKAADPLTKLLQDADRGVRYQAVRALHELGPGAAAAVPQLTSLILNSREQEPARQWAIKTLVVTLPKTKADVVKALVEASGEKTNYGVRQLARQQLKIVDPMAAKEAGIP